ncbi:MAG: YedE family putative selenium transporter [Dehalococcoidia bacterium]
MSISWLLAQKRLIILAGVIFGVLGAMLVEWGNPANMGICIACFWRDITGAVGLHRASVVQYIRPEIIGIVFGALLSSLVFREFRSRGGSTPLIRFILGALFMIGALVFLGCPVRALLRLAGGDLNGITALAGIIVGALIGISFLRRGFNLGRANRMKYAAGWAIPLMMVGLLLILLIEPSFLFGSESGPGAMQAAIGVSIAVGAGVGLLAQRTRMCFVGGWRDIFLTRDFYLVSGIVAFFIGAIITNAILGNITWGFKDQPVAHDEHLWNFLGMLLAGLSATLLGGCPLRQTILASEGDTDAGITVLGLVAGAALAHNFMTAASPAGIGDFSVIAVIIGIVFCLGIGIFFRETA